METITLHCIVDSNPPPQYYWTKGSSREVRAFSAGWGIRRVGFSRFRILEVRLRNWFEDGLNQELFFIFWYGYIPSKPSIPYFTILGTWSVSSVKVTKIELERFGLNVLLMTYTIASNSKMFIFLSTLDEKCWISTYKYFYTCEVKLIWPNSSWLLFNYVHPFLLYL